MNVPAAELYEQMFAALQGADAEHAHRLASALCAAEPDNYKHQQMAGIAAQMSNHPDAALMHFRCAATLATIPQRQAMAWTGMGQAYLLTDKVAEAEAALRRALSLVHELPQALSALAEALERGGRFDEAEQVGRRAIELGIHEPRLHIVLGHACLDQGKLTEAETEFRTAMALEPEAPEPQFGLGLIAKVSGQLDAARARFRAALDKTPEYPGYSQFASLKRFSAEDEDIALFERRLAVLAPDAPHEARADLLFALAKACDDADRTEEASRYLVEGNRLESAHRPYDMASDEARMQRIEALFTREFIGRCEGGGLAGLQPIFVISLPRSGSTLTEQMLAAHSAVRGGGELGHFIRVANRLSLKWGARADFPEIEETAAREDLREAGREYAKLTAALRLLTPHFTDKTLLNFLYIGLIAMMLPDAKIVHVRRHPLATALGMYRQHFAHGLGYTFDLELIARYYRAYARLMRHWRQVVPEAFTEIFYERLVAEPEHELRRVLAYVGLEFEPQCLEYYRLERPVRTASVIQVRQPLNREGLERHQRYRKLLAPVAEALSDEIAVYEAELAAATGSAGT